MSARATALGVLALLAVALPLAADPPVEGGSAALRAAYSGRAVGDRAEFTVRIDARGFEGAWGEVRFPSSDVRIGTWSCDPPASARLLSDGAAPKFLLQTEGECRIEAVISVPIVHAGELASLELPLVSAATYTVEFAAEGRDLDFAVDPESPLEVSGEASNRVRVAPGPGDSLTLRWFPKARRSEFGPAFRAEEQTFARVANGVVDATSRFRLSVERGGLERLAIRLTPRAGVMAVEGEAVSQWYVENRAEDRLLHVLFSPRIVRESWIAVRHDAPLDAVPGTVVLAPPEVIGAREQTGTVGVAADPELSVREEKVEGAERVDLASLRATFSGGADSLRTGYRWSRLPAAIALQVERRVPRLRASAESSVLLEKEALILRSLELITIDEIGTSTLAFRVPADLSVLGISGKDVRDWRTTGDTLQVNLIRRTLGTVAIQVEAQAATAGRADVVIPRLELLDAVESSEVVGVTPRGDISVETEAAGGVAQLDPKELPEWLRKLGSRLAYRYRERKGAVTVKVTPLTPEARVQVLSRFRVESDRMSGSHAISADVSRAPLFAIELAMPAGQDPLKVEGGTVRDWTFRDSDRTLRVELNAGVKGPVGLTVFTETLRARPDAAVALGVPTWKAAREQRGWVALAASEDIDLTPQTAKNLGEAAPGDLPAELRREGPARLAWRLADGAWSAKVAAAPAEPKITAKDVTIVELRRGLLTALCLVDLQVERAGLRRLSLRLPADAVNSHVDAEGLQSKHLVGGVWDLTFAGSVRGALRLKVGYERPVAEGAPEVVLTPLEIAGVEHHTGTVLVARDESGSEVALVRTEGMGPIRKEDLPAELRDAGLSFTHLLAFPKGDARAVFRVTSHERGAIEEAHMTTCDLHTLVQADGDALTYLTGHVTNTSKPYLELDFHGKASPWGAYVDGEPVKLGKGEKDKVRVPLPRNNGGAPRECEVSVVWTQKMDPLGFLSRPSFKAPATDVKMETVRWAVYLPDGYHIMGSGGSLRLANVDLGLEAPDLFARMGRALETAVPRWLVDAVGAAVPYALGGLGLLVAVVLLLRLRDQLSLWGVGPGMRFATVVCLLLVCAVTVTTMYGQKVARLFKSATQSLDSGRPMASEARMSRSQESAPGWGYDGASKGQINTQFTLAAMERGRAEGQSGYEMTAGLVAAEPQADAPAQQTIGNYRQKVAVVSESESRKGANKEMDPARESDHNESADSEDATIDFQSTRGNVADRRLRDLEQAAANAKGTLGKLDMDEALLVEEEKERNADGRLYAADRLEKALVGKSQQMENAKKAKEEFKKKADEQKQMKDALSGESEVGEHMLAASSDDKRRRAGLRSGDDSGGDEAGYESGADAAPAEKPGEYAGGAGGGSGAGGTLAGRSSSRPRTGRPSDKSGAPRAAEPPAAPGAPQPATSMPGDAYARTAGGAEPASDPDSGALAYGTEPSGRPGTKTPSKHESPRLPIEPTRNLGLEHAQAALQSVDATMLRRVERGLCEGAVPIAISFPVGSARKLEFSEMALAGGEARLDLTCVSGFASLSIQLGTVGLLAAGLLIPLWGKPMRGALVAGLALGIAFAARSAFDAPMQPYVNAALWTSGAATSGLVLRALARLVGISQP